MLVLAKHDTACAEESAGVEESHTAHLWLSGAVWPTGMLHVVVVSNLASCPSEAFAGLHASPGSLRSAL